MNHRDCHHRHLMSYGCRHCCHCCSHHWSANHCCSCHWSVNRYCSCRWNVMDYCWNAIHCWSAIHRWNDSRCYCVIRRCCYASPCYR